MPAHPPHPAGVDPRADLATIRATLRGDRAAGERLGERLRVVPRILAAVNACRGRRLGTQQLEDLSQDVLVIIWRKLDRFEGTGTLESWIYRICFYEYLNQVTRRRPKPLDDVVEPAADSERVLDPMDSELLDSALTQLGPPEEVILRMRHYDEMSFAEIGEELEVSTNTVKTRYYRGIRWLRQRLKNSLRGDA